MLGFDPPYTAPWIRFWYMVSSARDTGIPNSRAMSAHRGHHHCPRLADRGERLGHVFAPDHTDGDDGAVRALPVGHAPGELRGVGDVAERVGRPELQGLLPLELHRVDSDDVAGPGVRPRPGPRCMPTPPGPHDDHDVTRAAPRPCSPPSPSPFRRRSRAGRPFRAGVLVNLDHRIDVDRGVLDKRADARPLTDGRAIRQCAAGSCPDRRSREPIIVNAPKSQRFCMPDAHQRQRPQIGRKEKTTWSPTRPAGCMRAHLLDYSGALVATAIG